MTGLFGVGTGQDVLFSRREACFDPVSKKVIHPAGKPLVLFQKGEDDVVPKPILTHKAKLHSLVALFHQAGIHFLEGSLPDREGKVNKK